MKKLLLSLLLCLSLQAKITLSSYSEGANQIGTGTTGVTFSHITLAGGNRELVVVITGVVEAAVTSVTYNGQALTLIQTAGTFWTNSVWRLNSPPVGTANVVIVWPSTPNAFDNGFAQAYGLQGINQNNPIHASSVTASPALTASITTTVADTFILGSITCNHGTSGTIIPSSTMIEQWTFGANAATAATTSVAYLQPETSGSKTFTWALSGGATTAQGIVLVALEPAPILKTSNGGGMMISPPAPYYPLSSSLQYQGANTSGDTNECVWVGSGVKSGSWGGGSLICNSNDITSAASSVPGCTNKTLCLYEILTYNKTSTAGNTFGFINAMTSYGTSGANSCYDQATNGATNMKTRVPFSLPGLLFLTPACNKDTSYESYQSGIIVSPNGGLNWCNYKTFQAGGNTCTSSNWAANGDNPVDAAGFQFPLANNTNKMTRLTLVDFGCQDQTTNCPTIPGLDTSYLYLFGSLPDFSGLYIFRTLKSNGINIMLPSNWTAYNNGVWDSTLLNATNQKGNMIVTGAATSKMMWNPSVGLFTIGYTNQFATAPLPWGPWVYRGAIKPSDSGWGSGFQAAVPALCPIFDVSSRVGCVISSNGFPGGQDIYLRYTDIGPIPSVWH